MRFRSAEPKPPQPGVRRRLSANLIAYVVITLLGLYAFAESRAPHHGLTEAGCRVGFVYDGDTVELLCGPDTQTARLVGFDTPETKQAGCPQEAALGHKAKLRLGDLVAKGQGDILLDRRGYDKFGRTLVVMQIGGRSVADMMIAEGLAVAYSGDARIDWCARLAGSG